MKKWVRRFVVLIAVFVLYTFFFGVLIFNFPLQSESGTAYDTQKLMHSDETLDTTYATILDDNQKALDVRLALIESANEKIDVSYYTLHDGRSRDLIFSALHDAAERGVEVRIILDGIFYYQTVDEPEYVEALKSHELITVKLYERYNPLLPHTIQNRLHDKLLIIDGTYGITGGRNIGDRFFFDGEEGLYSSTKDRDILIHSDKAHKTVESMHTYYNTLFAYEHTHTLKKDIENAETLIGEMHAAMTDYRNTYSKTATLSWIEANKVTVDNATFVHSPLSRMHKDPVLLKTFSAIASESDALFVQSPYIIFSKRMLEDFPDYNDKDITVLTNNMDKGTNLFAMSGYIRYRDLINEHATLYEYQGDTTIHAKTMTFDSDISVIGSFNLDPRSASLSTESAIIIVSEDFKSALDTVIEPYLNQSLEVNGDGDYVTNPAVPAYPENTEKRRQIRLRSLITRFFDAML
ncbi:MAG: phospholipase D-like domain-containing protein [Bacillota bacterium]